MANNRLNQSKEIVITSIFKFFMLFSLKKGKMFPIQTNWKLAENALALFESEHRHTGHEKVLFITNIQQKLFNNSEKIENHFEKEISNDTLKAYSMLTLLLKIFF